MNALPSHLLRLSVLPLQYRAELHALVLLTLRVKMLVPAYRLPLNSLLSVHNEAVSQKPWCKLTISPN